MLTLAFHPAIAQAAPGLRVMLVEADIHNGPTPDALWEEITLQARRVRQELQMPDINRIPAIAATRQAYKALGKEPNRYRPSAEALMRRMVKGLDLYRTLTAIDLINLLSVITGHSIGGFDADAIDGPTLTLGVGHPGEPYLAIGRGPLNIESLPVFRDATGGVGTPTSDNERTKLTPDTRRLVMTINQYGPGMPEDQLEALTRRLLTDYAQATDIRTKIYTPFEAT